MIKHVKKLHRQTAQTFVELSYTKHLSLTNETYCSNILHINKVVNSPTNCPYWWDPYSRTPPPPGRKQTIPITGHMVDTISMPVREMSLIPTKISGAIRQEDNFNFYYECILESITKILDSYQVAAVPSPGYLPGFLPLGEVVIQVIKDMLIL